MSKGVLRSIHCNANYNFDMIPVDIAINNLIVIAYWHHLGEVNPSCLFLSFFVSINIPEKHLN